VADQLMSSGPHLVVAVAGLLMGSFLLGALPFALWVGRLVRGTDIREFGSGNLGATNALRVLGPFWGILTLCLDVGKGWVAVALLPGILGLGTVAEGSPWPLTAAIAAVLGHSFSPLAAWRGGKGVATSLGAFLALAPLAAGLAVVGFIVAVWVSGFVSLGSLVLTLIFPVAALFWGPPPPLRALVVGVGLLLALLVALRHRPNWARIKGGTETRFRWRVRE
jgi:glycerol-3-phosphate acyltransferase PlsY